MDRLILIYLTNKIDLLEKSRSIHKIIKIVIHC